MHTETARAARLHGLKDWLSAVVDHCDKQARLVRVRVRVRVRVDAQQLVQLCNSLLNIFE